MPVEVIDPKMILIVTAAIDPVDAGAVAADAFLENRADRFGLRQRQGREIRDGALDDPLALANGLTQQDCRAGIAVRNDVDVHGFMYSQ